MNHQVASLGRLTRELRFFLIAEECSDGIFQKPQRRATVYALDADRRLNFWWRDGALIWTVNRRRSVPSVVDTRDQPLISPSIRKAKRSHPPARMEPFESSHLKAQNSQQFHRVGESPVWDSDGTGRSWRPELAELSHSGAWMT